MSDFTKIKDKMNSKQGQGWSPTVSAKGNSVVTAREITNVTGKNLNCRIETGSDPGSMSGSAGGQDPHTDHTACGGSVICVDKISDVTVDDNIDLSVSRKTSQGGAGTENGTLPSSQDPADEDMEL